MSRQLDRQIPTHPAEREEWEYFRRQAVRELYDNRRALREEARKQHDLTLEGFSQFVWVGGKDPTPRKVAKKIFETRLQGLL
jgi:hypothetical protein